MAMLVEPLRLTTPIAAFNGGLFARPDLTVISQKEIPTELVDPVIATAVGRRPRRLAVPRRGVARARPEGSPMSTARRGP